jgi:hypothetical protein
VLDTHPKADLRVYAVWFNMMASDSRERWRETLLRDRRVTHFWDEGKTVGTWFGARTEKHDVLWDAWMLYGPDARWDDEPTGVLGTGRTIMASRDELKATIDRLF